MASTLSSAPTKNGALYCMRKYPLPFGMSIPLVGGFL